MYWIHSITVCPSFSIFFFSFSLIVLFFFFFLSSFSFSVLFLFLLFIFYFSFSFLSFSCNNQKMKSKTIFFFSFSVPFSKKTERKRIKKQKIEPSVLFFFSFASIFFSLVFFCLPSFFLSFLFFFRLSLPNCTTQWHSMSCWWIRWNTNPSPRWYSMFCWWMRWKSRKAGWYSMSTMWRQWLIEINKYCNSQMSRVVLFAFFHFLFFTLYKMMFLPRTFHREFCGCPSLRIYKFLEELLGWHAILWWYDFPPWTRKIKTPAHRTLVSLSSPPFKALSFFFLFSFEFFSFVNNKPLSICDLFSFFSFFFFSPFFFHFLFFQTKRN